MQKSTVLLDNCCSEPSLTLFCFVLLRWPKTAPEGLGKEEMKNRSDHRAIIT